MWHLPIRDLILLIFLIHQLQHIIKTFDTPGDAYGIDVSGNHAFIADGSARVEQ